MKALLDAFLPRALPGLNEGEHFQCVPHEGKSDLDKSIPVKLRGWREPGVRFIVVRDNDGGDCKKLKERLVEVCSRAKRPDTIVRLICQELESWHLGDLEAVATAFEEPKASSPAVRAKYREPDALLKPSVELRRLVPSYQKIGGSRRMGEHITADANQSASFQCFVAGVLRAARELGYQG